MLLYDFIPHLYLFWEDFREIKSNQQVPGISVKGTGTLPYNQN